MTPHSYDALNAEVMRFYGDGAFDAAYALLTREGAAFPEELAQVLYLRSCLAVRIGQPALAVDLICEALDQGIWYSAHLLRASPSWAPLQGQPAFEALVTRSHVQQEAARVAAQVFTAAPTGGCSPSRPCPLVLALHGNGDNGRRALAAWRPAVADGWLVAALQSSQAAWSDGFIWDDPATAARDIATQYTALGATYALDSTRVVLGGFSMGGETALRQVLNGGIAARGFVLLGPGGPTMDTPDAWLPLIRQGAARGVRGVIYLGDADPVIAPDALRTLVARLDAGGVPCLLEIVPGLGHAYPADFGPGVRRALTFVLADGP